MAKGFISGLVWGVLVSGVAGAGVSVYNSGSYKGLIAPEVAANKAEDTDQENMDQAVDVKLDEAQPDAAQLTEPDTSVTPAPKAQSPAPVKVDEPAKAEEQSPEPVSEPEQPEATSPAPSVDGSVGDSDAETKDETRDQTGNTESQEAQHATDTAEPDTAEPEKNPEVDVTQDVTQDDSNASKADDQLAMQTNAQTQEPKDQTPPVTDVTPELQKDASEAEQDQAAEKPASSLMVPVLGIENMAPNVETSRLPSIGNSPNGTETATETEAATGDQPVKDQGALADFAADFDNPNQLPVMSIVLIDDQKAPVPDNVLKNLPFSITFAIDAVRDDALAVSQRYRNAGFEVMMLTNLPFGAQASDIEVAYQAYSRAIPEAIGVLDLGGNGFLRGASTAKQVADILADSGAGLVTPAKGLNTAQKTALKAGVPAGLIFRELDKDGENPAVIRRYLDRAIFQAKQEGYAIMLGHTRPETIEALVQWALEDRAASVAIGPVSAALKGI